MPFNSITQFEKSFPAVKNLTPEQKQKAFSIFNAMKRETPDMDDGRAIAIAIKRSKGMGDTEKMKNVISENILHYLSTIDLSENKKSSVIEVLRAGVLQDRGLSITPKMLEDYVDNFNNNVYGTEIQVNLGHNRDGEAAGWVKQLFVDNDKLMARVEWTELGKEKILKRLFKFISAELAPNFPHHLDGKLVSNVFIGAALTNTPALKGQSPIVLSEYLKNLINKTNMFKEKLAQLKEQELVTFEEKQELKNFYTLLSEEEQAENKQAVEEVMESPEPSDEPAAEGEVEEVKEAENEPAVEEDNNGGAGEENQHEQLEEEVKEEQENTEPVEEQPADQSQPEENTVEAEVESAPVEEEQPEEQPAEELREKVSLQKFNELKANYEDLRQKFEFKELSEQVNAKYCLSERNNIGFNKSSQNKVVKFLMSLSSGQRGQFNELFKELRVVDLSVKGSVETANLSGDFNDQVVELAEKLLSEKKAENIEQAQKMAHKQLTNK